MMEAIQIFLADNTAGLLAAMNIFVALIGAIVGALYIWRYSAAIDHKVARLISLGIGFTALGLSAHRFYWIIQRYAESHDLSWAYAMYHHWSWVTLFPLMLVVLGYSLHLFPFVRSCFGRNWFFNYSWFFVVVYLLIFILVSI